MSGAVSVLDAACGRVQGVACTLDDLGEPAAPVHAWLGIPYAQAPVGPLRWHAPVPLAPWAGVHDATRFAPDTVQAPGVHLRAGRQSEDALAINIWAPAQRPARGLPVMVWFHGGGFTGGSGSDRRCDGAALARRGVVVVSFNYRSGVFGFLAHPELCREDDRGCAGNYGLLDQLQALRWVRDHIAAFGGDPRRVTVFGVSAGSASIALLLTSPLASGLFHRAILHSPGAGRPLATLDEATAAGAGLGLSLAELRALPAAQVQALTSRLNPAMRALTRPRVLRPIVDGHVLPRQELDALQTGQFETMPLIVGSNRDEGSLLTASWPVDSLAAYRVLMADNFGDAQSEAMRHYPAASDAQARPAVAAAFADTQFNLGVRLLARAAARRGPDVWRYLFMRRRPGQAQGPHHGEEVAYVFDNLRACWGAVPDLACRSVAAAMGQAWVDFAGGHDPAPAGADRPWSRFDIARDNHFVFDAPLAVGAHWRRDALDFLEHGLAGPRQRANMH